MMNAAISKTSWHGQNAWVLESDIVRTVVVPEMGAKLVSLFDKRSQLEWLVGSGDRPFKKSPYGASFVEQDMSGWDEMFPTIVACDYPAPGERHNVPLPDHGEVWPLAWALEPTRSDKLRLSVKGEAISYRLTRTLTFSAADTLLMQYELENISGERMPYIWSAHPQFICGDAAVIILPSRVKEVCNTLPTEWGWGEPETRFDWPEALRVDGQQARIDRTGPASLKQARKFFVPPEISIPWAGLIRQPQHDWLRLDWDPDQAPYLGLWVDEGKISHEAVAALEPMTGYYDSLVTAWEKGLVAMIEPEETQSWSLLVSLGTGERPFPRGDRPTST
jgi:galactose mutarotase-like enzyme